MPSYACGKLTLVKWGKSETGSNTCRRASFMLKRCPAHTNQYHVFSVRTLECVNVKTSSLKGTHQK